MMKPTIVHVSGSALLGFACDESHVQRLREAPPLTARGDVSDRAIKAADGAVLVWELFQDDDLRVAVHAGPPPQDGDLYPLTVHRAKPALLRLPTGRLAVESVESLEVGGGAVVEVEPGDHAVSLVRVLPESFSEIEAGGADTWLCLQQAAQVSAKPLTRHLAFPHPGMTTLKIEQLLRRLMGKGRDNVCRAINQLTDARHHPRAGEIGDRLLPLRTSPDELVRWNVAYTLGHVGAARHAEILAEMARDDEARVREGAWEALGLLQAPEAAQPVILSELDRCEASPAPEELVIALVRVAGALPGSEARALVEELAKGPDRRTAELVKRWRNGLQYAAAWED